VLSVTAEFSEIGRAASRETAVERLVWLPSEETTVPAKGMTSYDALLDHGPNPPAHELDASMPAQIIYTSGTESRPKGAVLTHAAVIAEYVTCLVDAEIAERDVVLHALPLYHCAQLDVFFGPCVYVGATSVITSRPTPENLLAMMAQYAINSFFAPPTVWIGLLRAPQFDDTDLS